MCEEYYGDAIFEQWHLGSRTRQCEKLATADGQQHVTEGSVEGEQQDKSVRTAEKQQQQYRCASGAASPAELGAAPPQAPEAVPPATPRAMPATLAALLASVQRLGDIVQRIRASVQRLRVFLCILLRLLQELLRQQTTGQQ